MTYAQGVVLLAVLLMLITQAGVCQDRAFTQLMGWGGGDPATVVEDAADVGFTDIIVWNKDRDYLTRLVQRASERGIGVYVSIFLGDTADWKKRHPDLEPPLQVINEAEQAAASRLKAELKAGETAYQYGGEPVSEELEVFTDPLLCFHAPGVLEFFQAQIRDILAVPGITGIALDYFGYRNYRCCRCPHSMARLAEFRAAHPDLTEAQAEEQFSLETLVGICNDLADYARKIKPAVQVTGHVYPVYLPEPLYGNRLNWDTCGQTGAWFFEPFWSEEKIRAYSRTIAADAQKYWADVEGAALIGIYVKPGKYPVKAPERIERELCAIWDGGVRCVQVCSLNDVLKDPATREVFRKFSPRK